MIVTKQEFARIIGSGGSNIDNYVAEGMPGYTAAPSRGHIAKVELELAVPWLIKRAKGQDVRKALDEARTRLADEQQRRTELDVRRMKGELIDVERVERTWTRLVANFRARILGMPSKLAGVLVGVHEPNVIRDRIEDECNQALGELTDEGLCRGEEADEAPPAGGGIGGEAAAAADDQRVG